MRAVRAWAVSVVACVCLLAVWAVGMQAITWRWEHLWPNMLNVSIAFGAMFAIVAAILHVPVFAALGARGREPLARRTAVLVGAALAPAAYLAVAWRFGDLEETETVWSVLLFWIANLPAVALGMLPYVAAGALFGWSFHGGRPR